MKHTVDLTVRESKTRKIVDRCKEVSPESVVFLMNTKYSNKLTPRKQFKETLVRNVDECIKLYEELFGFKKGGDKK